MYIVVARVECRYIRRDTGKKEEEEVICLLNYYFYC